MSISIQLHFYYGFISPIYDHLLLGQSPKWAPCIHCFLLISSPPRILIATADLSVGSLRGEEPGTWAPTRHLGMEVPLHGLWLSLDGRSSSPTGLAPVIAIGAWEGASGVNSKLERCKIFPGCPYSFIEFFTQHWIGWQKRAAISSSSESAHIDWLRQFSRKYFLPEEAAKYKLSWQWLIWIWLPQMAIGQISFHNGK